MNAREIAYITVTLNDQTERKWSVDEIKLAFSFVHGDFWKFLELMAWVTSLDKKPEVSR